MGEPQSTTEPPTTAPHPNWTITGDGCHTADESCIESNNFPGTYGNSEACQIDLHQALHMTVQSFETESEYDHLTINGIECNGVSHPGPQNVHDEISWTSDSSVVNGGWRICFDEPQSTTDPPTTAPHPNWTITGDGCHTADENCIESNNFPGDYDSSEACLIHLQQALHMTVQSFETESGYDHLTINGIEYNGVS